MNTNTLAAGVVGFLQAASSSRWRPSSRTTAHRRPLTVPAAIRTSVGDPRQHGQSTTPRVARWLMSGRAGARSNDASPTFLDRRESPVEPLSRSLVGSIGNDFSKGDATQQR